jgi:two-component system NtrC family sensor kinase
MSGKKDVKDWEGLLSEQLEMKEAIINGISDALMLLDTRTHEILAVNRAFLEFYGSTSDQVLGRKCYEVTHHLDVACHHANVHSYCPLEESRSGNPSQREHAHQDKNGQTLYLEINAYPLKNASGEVTRIVHVSRNITERKRLELETMEKEKLNAVLELAGGTSHEINQPLTVIISGLEQLLKRMKPGEPEHDLTGTILEHAGRLREVSMKLAGITHYASKEYLAESRIIDLDRASSKDPPR